MAGALKRQMANWNMGFEEAEIRRKMGEIADWLKDQAEPQTAAPRLHAVVPPASEAEPALPPRTAEEGSLADIVERRLAARRQREEAAEPEISSLREVMDRFSGPLTAASEPQKRGPLRSAIAEIVERQRELESEPLQPLSEPHPLRRAMARPVEQAPAETMEFAFERLVARFEARAAQSFQTLEASLADVRSLIEEAKTPIEAAEAAAAYIVQTKLHALETDTNGRIEEVARDLASFRADTTDSERRTRDLLDAVRKTLEHVASRLPERLGQTEPAFAPEANPSVRARAAALRAIEESAEPEPFDLLARHKVAEPERRHYIAAARRSTQPPEPQETTAKYRPLGAPPRPRPAMVTASEPHPRFRMKRVLLASSAAAVLLLGIYAGSSRFLDDMFSGQQTAVLPDEGAAQTQAVASSAATPGAESATTGAGELPSPGLLSALPVSPGTFLPNDPVITGSIPQDEPRLAPLPIDIGGHRLRERAEAGDAAAQYEAGTRFLEGRGVPRDYEKAAAWLERAAAQGLAPAQYHLGSLMEKGNGLAKDLEGARRLYEQAANAGNVQAMHNLGVLYAEGGLGQPDMAIALVWFQKAADYGVRDSQFNLGIFYAKGLAVPKDFSQSYLWFTLAAAQGDKDAADKREQIGAKIDAQKIKALKVTADTWKPKTAVFEANSVLPPPEGWDDTPNGRAGPGGKAKPI